MGKFKNVILALIVVALLVGYYFYLTNKQEAKEEVTISNVQNLILRNLETDYPPTPKEVVKFYAELTKCVYNDTYSEEEYGLIVDQMLKMYDSELQEINPKEFYMLSLKKEVDNFRKDGKSIVSFTTSSSTDVVTSIVNGDECAKLYCTFVVRKAKKDAASREIFELRKDAEGHWKILGFKLEEEQ